MKTNGLTREQLDRYRNEGYLVIERFFDDAALRRVYAAIDELTEKARKDGAEKILEWEPNPADGRQVPRRIYNPFDQHEAFKDMGTDPHLLDTIESIIGPDINLQHSKLNMKPARVGSAVEWHQDLAYFPHTNDDLVTTLVYIDDANEENGCLQVLPRHNTHYFSHDRPDGSFAGMITEDVASGRWGQPVALPAPAGSAILMHCITPHSSLPNRSTRARRTLIYEYRANDAFPIYYGEMTAIAESKFRLLRGQPARFARFGGIRPMIPRKAGVYKSLYDVQAETKAMQTAARN